MTKNLPRELGACTLDSGLGTPTIAHSSMPGQFHVVLHSIGKGPIRKSMSLPQKERTWENTCSSFHQRLSCETHNAMKTGESGIIVKGN